MKHLELGDWFLIGICVLQFFAVASFIYKKRWLEAIVYAAYMTAQIALVFLALRGRT